MTDGWIWPDEDSEDTVDWGGEHAYPDEWPRESAAPEYWLILEHWLTYPPFGSHTSRLVQCPLCQGSGKIRTIPETR